MAARITPAGAGKTQRKPRASSTSGDHPRRCGENFSATGLLRKVWGSPPQVRGKRCVRLLRLVLRRITPAGAGKTLDDDYRTFNIRDHPRRCGENYVSLGGVGKLMGSPPQVRGKRRPFANFTHVFRITPAGAGKTNSLHLRNSRLQDHPRRCGENLARAKGMVLDKGSPPQVRGKRYQHSNVIDLLFRITPAGAGKTSLIPTNYIPNKDHPRRCGENV